jgi:hypothetical protein
MIAGVADGEEDPISITLSPAQVAAVVHAASRSRQPTIATLIGRALAAPGSAARDGIGEASGSPPPGPADDAGPLSLATVDPRLSRSLLRGLAILTHFGPDAPERGIVELAGELGMSPSTTHRYAQTLVQLGLLERSPSSRKYRLPDR